MSKDYDLYEPYKYCDPFIEWREEKEQELALRDSDIPGCRDT